MRGSPWAFAAMLVLGCGRAALAQPAGVETPERTPSGATFTLPKAWSVRTQGAVVVASPPEPDAHLAIVDVGAAADAKDAATKAWALYNPARVHPFKVLNPVLPRNGWDERASVAYETSANEKLALGAGVLRKGARWTVLINDSSEANDEKRGAAQW